MKTIQDFLECWRLPRAGTDKDPIALVVSTGDHAEGRYCAAIFDFDKDRHTRTCGGETVAEAIENLDVALSVAYEEGIGRRHWYNKVMLTRRNKCE